MRFKEFLQEAIFKLMKGDIRFVYTGTLDADVIYSGFPSYYYDDSHGWMQEWLDPGTKIEYRGMRDLPSEHYAELGEFADHNAPWLLEQVDAVYLHYPDEFGKGREFYVKPSDLEKKTVDEDTYKKLKRDWMNSLKEAKKPRKIKEAPIVPQANTTYVIYCDPPDIMDALIVTSVPEQPKHGQEIPDGFFDHIPNGQKILFKHKITNDHGEFAVLEWKGKTYYTVWWMFPAHITTPEKYKQIQIDWMNSLKEAEGAPTKYPADQNLELVIQGEPFYQEIWGYGRGPNDDAKPFPNGTKINFQHYEADFYFTPHKPRTAAVAVIDGKEWYFKQEQFDECTMPVAEYKEWKRKWINSLKESAALTRDSIIAKMNSVMDENKYINCRLAVQLTIDHPKLEDLQEIKFKDIQIGDIIAWGKNAHWAIWLGNGDIIQVGGWGEPVTIEPLRKAREYWDRPRAYYKNPNR